MKRRFHSVRCVNMLLLIVCMFPVLAGGCNGRKKLDVIDLNINGRVFSVEVAITRDEHQRGLMHRKKMDENKGMLFAFGHDQNLSFWMQNTYIPLSIAYVSTDGTIKEIHDMKPLSEASVPSKYKVRYALELNRGAFGRAGIRPGDKIIFPPDFEEMLPKKWPD